jgi:ubiquinone/menaquinone biosynthesis C-methylase UbiE
MAHRDEYIHGTRAEEQARLSKLNEMMNRGSLQRLAIVPGERVLDVGSGLGHMSRAMAESAGAHGLVVGVERDIAQIGVARRFAPAPSGSAAIDFRLGDATDLPLADDEWGTFDVAHARFLLEHVSAPGAVVASMVRAVRPGGRIVLEDDDHEVLRLWPRSQPVERLWNAYMESYSRLGLDPLIGRRLVELLVSAGATPARNDYAFFGGCHGAPLFESIVANFVAIVAGARDTIVRLTHLTAAEVDEGIRAFQTWGGAPGAAMWYCTFWAEGRRP